MDCTQLGLSVPLHPVLQNVYHIMTKRFIWGVLFCSTSLSMAVAQQRDSSNVVDLDEVIIVAQPKEVMSLRQQPLSSIVFSDREMRQLSVTDLRQLSAYVPSFAMPDYGSRLTSSMYIRGLGSRVSNSAIGIYYDNIPLMSPAAFNSYFYHLERVDVLRGPQGTLYGANAEGGIVRLYSRDPMNYQGTDVTLGLAAGFQRRVEVAHSLKASDRFALSVAGFYHGQDGFFYNDYLKNYSDKMQEAGGKLRLIWKPTTRLTFDLSSDYQFTNQNGFPYGSYDVCEAWAALPLTNVQPGYKRNMVNTGLSIRYEMNKLLLSSTTSYQHLYDDMDMDIDYTTADNMQLNQKQKLNAVTEELTLRSKHDGMWQHVTGLFGSRRWLRTDATVDFGRAVLDPIGNAITRQMRNAQYEMVKSQTIDAMKKSMMETMVQQFLGRGMSQEAAEAAAAAAIASPAMTETFENAGQKAAQGAVEKAGLNANVDVMRVPNTFRQPITNVALYHESSLTFAERLTATLGLRYDYTRAEIEYDALGYVSVTAGSAKSMATSTVSSHLMNHHKTSFGQLLPKVGLSYRVDKQGSNIYASVSKGYMAGGYNIQLFSDILQADLGNMSNMRNSDYEVPHTEQDYADIEEAISYKPEESWNYEVGAHLNLFGNKLHADVAAFYTQLRNQQLTVMAPEYGFGRMTVNAGKSRSLGAEVALRGNLAEGHLTWAATYSYTNAKFVDFKDFVKVNNVNTEVNYKDNYIPYVPQHAFSAAADYRIDLRDDRVLRSVTIGANVQGNGKTYWDDANTASQKLYALLGAHVKADLGVVDVDFWGKNLTDTRYCVFAMPFNNAYIGQRGLPFQLGVDMHLHF